MDQPGERKEDRVKRQSDSGWERGKSDPKSKGVVVRHIITGGREGRTMREKRST